MIIREFSSICDLRESMPLRTSEEGSRRGDRAPTGYVYWIENVNGWFKIGATCNPENRMYEHLRWRPYFHGAALKRVVFTEVREDYRDLERSIHGAIHGFNYRSLPVSLGGSKFRSAGYLERYWAPDRLRNLAFSMLRAAPGEVDRHERRLARVSEELWKEMRFETPTAA